jgi:hypothetical protein
MTPLFVRRCLKILDDLLEEVDEIECGMQIKRDVANARTDHFNGCIRSSLSNADPDADHYIKWQFGRQNGVFPQKQCYYYFCA